MGQHASGSADSCTASHKSPLIDAPQV